MNGVTEVRHVAEDGEYLLSHLSSDMRAAAEEKAQVHQEMFFSIKRTISKA